MALPASAELTKYALHEGVTGSSTSEMIYSIDIDDYDAFFDAIVDTVDSTAASDLYCDTVDSDYLNGDLKTGKLVCVCHFVPYWKLLAQLPTFNGAVPPLRRSIEIGTANFTVRSGAWTWSSGAPITNQNVMPQQLVGIQEINLVGCRGHYSPDSAPPNLETTFGPFRDMLNSDTFLGFTAGNVIFRGVTASPRQLADGYMTDELRVHLTARTKPWNWFYNETTGLWEAIRNSSGGNVYTSTAFAGLLNGTI